MNTIMLVLTIFWMGEAQNPLMLEERFKNSEECVSTAVKVANKLGEHPKVTRVQFQCVRGDTT